MKKRISNYHEYLIESLKDSREATAYLNAALAEEDDPAAFLTALKNVAEAHGISYTAKKAGLNRESFYRMLSRRGNPKISSLYSLIHALGLNLRVEPA